MRAAYCLLLIASEVGDIRSRIDEPRHSPVARAMLFRDRQRLRDIAGIHDFGRGRVAAAQKRPLFETAYQPGE